MAISGCIHPVAVVIFVQGQEQFLLVVPVSLGLDEYSVKLFFMYVFSMFSEDRDRHSVT